MLDNSQQWSIVVLQRLLESGHPKFGQGRLSERNHWRLAKSGSRKTGRKKLVVENHVKKGGKRFTRDACRICVGQ